MVDVEFRVVSDRREGLLLALGQTVIANGFTLLRQRMAGCAEGVLLTLLVRGPEANLLMLEERLGTHHLVKSFESGPAAEAEAAAPPPLQPAASVPADAAGAATPAEPSIATRRVETLLPQIARSYPNINILVQALRTELPPAQREPTLTHVGQRVGTWVYKRDFALGGRLSLHDALRRIAVPAVRQLVHAELEGDALVVDNSPFFQAGQGASCHFLRGMLEGLLGGPHGTDGLVAIERECRGAGAGVCRFEFEH
ncbi:4-vinyl reductase [Marilutibacter chinensis]|uniref:4-vinyl reductase n=1 Tax=Marilutibacter chinensis TaxID=2912247 RepID=A0ABS9HUG2_9GAMM|nr:4-vinyl reductase [Lysobacter chinensis]MCF7221737.1 4-vinyl reductase [Lysobacter chinensis]